MVHVMPSAPPNATPVATGGPFAEYHAALAGELQLCIVALDRLARTFETDGRASIAAAHQLSWRGVGALAYRGMVEGAATTLNALSEQTLSALRHYGSAARAVEGMA